MIERGGEANRLAVILAALKLELAEVLVGARATRGLPEHDDVGEAGDERVLAPLRDEAVPLQLALELLLRQLRVEHILHLPQILVRVLHVHTDR